jgi:hypothetical protein
MTSQNSRDRFIDDPDLLGGVHCGGERFRDDDGDGFSNVSHGIASENRMRCDEKPGAVAVAERHLVRVRRHRAMRDRFQPLRRRIASGQRGDDPWPTDRLCHIYLHDLRVGVGRTYEIPMELARQAEVTCVLSGTGEQSCVLAARYRFSDAMRGIALAGGQKRHKVLSPKCLLVDGLYLVTRRGC